MNLTNGEKELYDYLLQGMTNLQIARKLSMKESGIKWRATGLYKKCGVKSRAELIARDRAEKIKQNELDRIQDLAGQYGILKEVVAFEHERVINNLNIRYSNYRNVDDIIKVWPNVLEKMKIHKDSQVAKNMLNYLLDELGLK